LTPEFRIISIGTLAAHPLWNEKGDTRTAHATTTLISVGDLRMLVNPALPAQALIARMSERTPVRPKEITHIFITAFDQDHRRALRGFEHATWLMHEPEREAALSGLNVTRGEAKEADDRELITLIDQERSLLDRFQNAADSIAPNVDLFPLPGVTAGTCGLLLALPGSTVVICGDAIATAEHLAQGKVLPHCASISQAQESFKEAVEIADALVLGRDNVAMNPLRRLG
jgi:glyoxylase-like metal-dependent hydrolase (beta-lactamase superfamily II)